LNLDGEGAANWGSSRATDEDAREEARQRMLAEVAAARAPVGLWIQIGVPPHVEWRRTRRRGAAACGPEEEADRRGDTARGREEAERRSDGHERGRDREDKAGSDCFTFSN
jgi:hypothetical protein